MPSAAEWEALISASPIHGVLVARTLLGERESSSTRPIRVIASDGAEYLIKFPQTGRPFVARTLVTEQIVSAAARLIDAPVAEVAQVDFSELAFEEHERFGDAAATVAHASKIIPDVVDASYEYAGEPENRPRFGAIGVLYTWVEANDYQYLYLKARPRLVFSFDHGECLPEGRNWTADALHRSNVGNVDPLVREFGQVSQIHMLAATARLAAITSVQLADIVALAPNAWGVSMEERIALAEYLDRRRQQTIDAVAAIL
jgi:hypothetical protein